MAFWSKWFSKKSSSDSVKDASSDLNYWMQTFHSTFNWCERISTPKHKELAEKTKSMGLNTPGSDDLIEFMDGLYSAMIEIQKDLDKIRGLLLKNDPSAKNEILTLKQTVENKLENQEKYVSFVRLILPHSTEFELIMGKSAAGIFPAYLKSVDCANKYLKAME